MTLEQIERFEDLVEFLVNLHHRADEIGGIDFDKVITSAQDQYDEDVYQAQLHHPDNIYGEN